MSEEDNQILKVILKRWDFSWLLNEESALAFPDVKGQEVPEGWCGSGKCSVEQRGVFGLGDGGQKVSVCRAEATSGGGAMEKISQVWGDKVIQSFEGDEEDPKWGEWMRCYMGSQWSWRRMGEMCSLEWVWVSNRAPEFWTYCNFWRTMEGRP